MSKRPREACGLASPLKYAPGPGTSRGRSSRRGAIENAGPPFDTTDGLYFPGPADESRDADLLLRGEPLLTLLAIEDTVAGPLLLGPTDKSREAGLPRAGLLLALLALLLLDAPGTPALLCGRAWVRKAALPKSVGIV